MGEISQAVQRWVFAQLVEIGPMQKASPGILEPRTVVPWAGFVEITSASFDRLNKMMRRGNIQDRTLLCVLLNWSHFPPSFQA